MSEAWPFPQPPTLDLSSLDIYYDLVNVVDKTGTYVNPAFPDRVLPAPRTHGPDGRLELFGRSQLRPVGIQIDQNDLNVEDSP